MTNVIRFPGASRPRADEGSPRIPFCGASVHPSVLPVLDGRQRPTASALKFFAEQAEAAKHNHDARRFCAFRILEAAAVQQQLAQYVITCLRLGRPLDSLDHREDIIAILEAAVREPDFILYAIARIAPDMGLDHLIDVQRLIDEL